MIANNKLSLILCIIGAILGFTGSTPIGFILGALCTLGVFGNAYMIFKK